MLVITGIFLLAIGAGVIVSRLRKNSHLDAIDVIRGLPTPYAVITLIILLVGAVTVSTNANTTPYKNHGAIGATLHAIPVMIGLVGMIGSFCLVVIYATRPKTT